MKKETKTSWQKSSRWYGSIVGEKGHFYHQSLVIPKSLPLLNLKKGDRLLDVACGQGVLARHISAEIKYLGVDVAKNLVEEAKRLDRNKAHKYVIGDVNKTLSTKEKYNKATIILALQNIENQEAVIRNISQVMEKEGKLLIVLNHPCFRIPRQSSWEEDKETKMQYRRVNRYMTPLSVPINTHPGQKNSPITWSFHHPIEDYAKYLFASDFMIERIEEWVSEKKSQGKAARMENRAREEFPMFMAILAVKR